MPTFEYYDGYPEWDFGEWDDDGPPFEVPFFHPEMEEKPHAAWEE